MKPLLIAVVTVILLSGCGPGRPTAGVSNVTSNFNLEDLGAECKALELTPKGWGTEVLAISCKNSTTSVQRREAKVTKRVITVDGVEYEEKEVK